MPINWDCELAITVDDPVILDCNFNASMLAIEIAASNQRETWFNSGYLSILTNFSGSIFVGKKYQLEFGLQLIEVPYLNYQLRFDSQNWLRDANIKIKQLSPSEIESIYRLYVSKGENILPEVAESIYSTVIPVSPSNPNPVFKLADARPRSSALIKNKTNKAVFIKEGAATSLPTLVAGDPFVSIPANGSCTVEDFSGEIVGLMAADFQAGGKIIVKEMPYLV